MVLDLQGRASFWLGQFDPCPSDDGIPSAHVLLKELLLKRWPKVDVYFNAGFSPHPHFLTARGGGHGASLKVGSCELSFPEPFSVWGPASGQPQSLAELWLSLF